MTRATIKVSVPGTPAQPGSGGESPGDAGRSRVIRTGNPAQRDPRPYVRQSELSSGTPDDTAGRRPQIICPPVRGTRETCLRVCTMSPLWPENTMPDAAYS